MKRRHIWKVRQACRRELSALACHALLREVGDGTTNEARTRALVLRWVKCARHDSEAFLRLLRALVGKLQELLQQNPSNRVSLEGILDILLENLKEEEGVDEDGNPDPQEAHYLHYIQLAHQLSLSLEDLQAYPAGEGVRYAVGLAESVPSWKRGKGVGYMLLNEGATPLVYGAIGQAVSRLFPWLRTKFFKLHVEVDVEHVKELYKAVALLPDDALEDVLEGVRLGSRGMTAILDEVYGYVDAA